MTSRTCAHGARSAAAAILFAALAIHAQNAPHPPTRCVADSGGFTLSGVIVNHTPGKDVFLALFSSAEDMQKSRACRAVRFIGESTRSDTLRVRLDSIPAGHYVIASFQDLDGNAEMTRGLFGLPKDPYRILLPNHNIFGPSFDKCKFAVAADMTGLVIDYAKSADRAGVVE